MGCCPTSKDAPRASRWNVTREEIPLDNITVDRKWLNVFQEAFIAAPSETVYESVQRLCDFHNMDSTETLDHLRQRAQILQDTRRKESMCGQSKQEPDEDDLLWEVLLHDDFEDHFLSIYSYTLESLFCEANRAMSSPGRLKKDTQELNEDVAAVVPWVKNVHIALAALPSSFDHHGTLYRVMEFRFDRAEFSRRFVPGNVFVWHTYRSTSRSEDILTNPSWKAETVFEICDAVGKDISLISFFPEECEILLCPGTTLEVLEAHRGSGRKADDIRTRADWIKVRMIHSQVPLEDRSQATPLNAAEHQRAWEQGEQSRGR